MALIESGSPRRLSDVRIKVVSCGEDGCPRAFDLALGKELEALVLEAKDRAAKIDEPSELWDLEGWLTERRREIDRRYDYRYSILPLVFAHLLRDGRMTEDDLYGPGQEKLDLIRRASAI